MQWITPDNEVLPSTSEYTMVGIAELRGKGVAHTSCGQDVSFRVYDGWSSYMDIGNNTTRKHHTETASNLVGMTSASEYTMAALTTGQEAKKPTWEKASASEYTMAGWAMKARSEKPEWDRHQLPSIRWLV